MHIFYKGLLCTLFSLLIFFKLFSQVTGNNTDILYWSQNHRLSFDDFKGKPTRNDTTAHEVNPKILTHRLGAIIESIDVHLLTEQNKTIFTIKAGMKQSASWIKDYGDTAELKHEQGHFDICEIYSRILIRDIRKAKSLAEAKEIYEQVSADEDAKQKEYDNENTYQLGGIKPDWEEWISNQLNELKDFWNPEVTLLFDK